MRTTTRPGVPPGDRRPSRKRNAACPVSRPAWWTRVADRRIRPRDGPKRVARKNSKRWSHKVLSQRQQQESCGLTCDGWSVPEIADEMSTTVERVSDEKYKAIRKLRKETALLTDQFAFPKYRRGGGPTIKPTTPASFAHRHVPGRKPLIVLNILPRPFYGWSAPF